MISKGNTVGSCENINWQKKWRSIKEKTVLTREQKSLIIGSLLGDGTMRVGRNAIHANFKVEHGLAQKEYVLWKYEILKPLVFTEAKLSYRYRANGEKYPKSWWFRTIRHPLLTEIYQKFYESEGYRNGKKLIPSDLETDLNPLSLSVWIMDDGCFYKGKIDISTYSFSISDIEKLKEIFQEKFGIEMNHYRDRDKGYRMYCRKSETEKLIKIIQPYIIPPMQYKIGFH